LDVLEEQTNPIEEENNELDVLVQKKVKLNIDYE
jgi:hypothetical protein